MTLLPRPQCNPVCQRALCNSAIEPSDRVHQSLRLTSVGLQEASNVHERAYGTRCCDKREIKIALICSCPTQRGLPKAVQTPQNAIRNQ